MDENSRLTGTLKIQGVADTTLEVIDFSGRDSISRPYVFEVLCACRDPNFSGSDMTGRAASLSLQAFGFKNAYSGVVISFQRMQTIDQVTFYKTMLVPRLKLLDLTEHNQVFLNQTIPQILESVFQECHLTNYDLRFMASYPAQEYVCQYNESHLNFISRWMEHYGIYYFFEENDQGEKLVLTDAKLSQTPLSSPDTAYRQVSGENLDELSQSVYSFIAEERIVAKEVVLKDFNYLKPSVDLLVKREVDPKGVGTKYHYGGHYQTVEQGEGLAKIRVEEILSGKLVYHGKGGCLPFRAGKLFSLSGHPDKSCNGQFQIISVEHSGRPTSALTSGLGGEPGTEEQRGYRNAFEARPADAQFRPAHDAVKTRFHGVVSAMVDAEGQGQYAYLDDMGRYKVRLPFDLAGRPDGHASSWLRLAEPYAGQSHGMHFPLLKGTEVLLSFVGGDPDRPVISSSAHNPQSPNPLQNQNTPLGVIKSAGRNQIVFNDAKGKEFLGMWSPYHNSGIALGSVKPGGGGSVSVQTNGDYESFVYGGENKIILGSSSEIVAGTESKVVGGAATDVVIGLSSDVVKGGKLEYLDGPALSVGNEAVEVHTERAVQGLESLTLSAGIQPSYLIAQESLNSPWLPLWAMIGTMLVGAGETAISALDAGGDDEADSASEFFKKIGEDVGLKGLYMIIPYAVEALGILGMVKLIEKQITSLTHHFQTQSTSNIEMGAGGIEIKVKKFPLTQNPPQGAQPPGDVSYEVSVSDTLQNSQKLEMSNAEGMKCTVTNVGVANTLQMNNTNQVAINAHSDVSITTDTQITTTSTGHGRTTVGPAGVTLEQTAGAKVEVTAASVKLTAPNQVDSITIGDTGLQLNFAGGNLHAGPLRINEAGIIQLG